MIKEIIEQEEGFRSHPYLCSEGYVTIGYGTKLHNEKGMNPEDFPLVLSKDAAYALLKDKVLFLHSQLLVGEYRNVYLGQSSARRDILMSMAYQMGVKGLYGFRNMWAALKAEAYSTAADEMLDSKWARQTPERAYRHSRAMSLNNLNEYM